MMYREEKSDKKKVKGVV